MNFYGFSSVSPTSSISLILRSISSSCISVMTFEALEASWAETAAVLSLVV